MVSCDTDNPVLLAVYGGGRARPIPQPKAPIGIPAHQVGAISCEV